MSLFSCLFFFPNKKKWQLHMMRYNLWIFFQQQLISLDLLNYYYCNEFNMSQTFCWQYFCLRHFFVAFGATAVASLLGLIKPLSSKLVRSWLNDRWPCCKHILIVCSSVWCILARKSDRAQCFISLRFDPSGICRIVRKMSRYSFSTCCRIINCNKSMEI